ncbi:MAG: nucleotide exchange factor GrpE [Ruminococcus sp.]|nr:nucleotide exchange factor GrpE [Ruminococcus sp.]MCD7812398.1 nucleotide exchange factor GrpE [Ruminococcus sp.]
MKEKNNEPLDELENDIPEADSETEEIPDNVDCDSGSDEDDAASEYNDTAAKIEEIENALQEANDKYLRLFAEYDNYRKRTSKEKTETYNNAVSRTVESLLPVVDSFERSLETDCSDENFKNGMNMIFTQLMGIMEKLGVTEVSGVGAEFDPNVHNAISQQDETDYASGYVCMVYQKGYKLGDKLIRPAMVAVAN